MSEDLILENDEHGTVTAGSKEKLVAHVRAGGAVRVALHTEDGERVTVLTPMAVFAKFNEVYAQVGWIGSDWREPNRRQFWFVDPPTSYTLNISTTGATHRRVVDFNNAVASDSVELGVRWYAD